MWAMFIVIFMAILAVARCRATDAASKEAAEAAAFAEELHAHREAERAAAKAQREAERAAAKAEREAEWAAAKAERSAAEGQRFSATLISHRDRPVATISAGVVAGEEVLEEVVEDDLHDPSV